MRPLGAAYNRLIADQPFHPDGRGTAVFQAAQPADWVKQSQSKQRLAPAVPPRHSPPQEVFRHRNATDIEDLQTPKHKNRGCGGSWGGVSIAVNVFLRVVVVVAGRDARAFG